MSSQDNKTASPASNHNANNDKKAGLTTPTTTTLALDVLTQQTPPKTQKKIVTVHVLIADHPTKKKPLPLTIDTTQPAHVLIREIAKLTRIPLEKLEVTYGGWVFPQDGLKRSCSRNYVSEGTKFVATKLTKEGTNACLTK